MRTHILICLVLTAVFGGTTSLMAQVDTTLTTEVMDSKDIEARRAADQKEVTAANRVSENPNELPVRAIVITKDEIKRNGYTSLVDVLKTLPGFRTSQPGSAFLGETFLMRGLLGNAYTKILINGIPVRPSAAPGMPLAAQLPIRQAERIEIIPGPASAAFGADAMAGVINIVLPDVERPVEATGSVALGNGGLDEVHLYLGGKLGKGRNVLRYNFYASSRRFQDIRLGLTEDMLTVDTSEIGMNQYFAGDSVAQLRNLPHESGMIGLSVNFRGFTYSYENLQREDHAAIGSHASDVAFHSPFAAFGERIHSHKFKFNGESGKWNFRSNVSALLYEVDNNSNYLGINHPISAGNNFMYAKSNDFYAEQLINFNLNERWDFMMGGNWNLQIGIPLYTTLDHPWDQNTAIRGPDGLPWVENAVDDELSNVSPISPLDTYFANDIGVFGHAYFHTDRLKVIAGGRLDKPENENLFFSPKVG
ncbi:MAG: TonB-dependent receptor plug domain-containing protein, partial [Bacteroidota bacterium]